MLPSLRRLAASNIYHMRTAFRRAVGAYWLVGLVLLTLSSCNRAAYVFQANSAAYLATERPAPSVPMPTDSAAPAVAPPTTTSERSAVPARRLAKKLRPLSISPSRHRLLERWARPMGAKVVGQRLAKLATAPTNTARQSGIASLSGKMIVALSLLGVGLLGILVGASLSTNIVGAIFGVFFFALGSLALIAGLILLVIALIDND